MRWIYGVAKTTDSGFAVVFCVAGLITAETDNSGWRRSRGTEISTSIGGLCLLVYVYICGVTRKSPSSSCDGGGVVWLVGSGGGVRLSKSSSNVKSTEKGEFEFLGVEGIFLTGSIFLVFVVFTGGFVVVVG